MTNKNFRFVHAADLHLDSPLVGLEVYRDAPVDTIRDATREALRRLVDLCIREEVQFLLIAGDIYDGDWKSMATGRFFADQMATLRNAGIPVFLIKGNHDAQSQISSEMTIPGVQTFSHKSPETRTIDELGVAIHGQSYARREVTEDLSAAYPRQVDGYFNIGMLHTCATGSSSLHKAYAPCKIEDLVRKGYDYWALGHVHQRWLLHSDPTILFPGNIQGRHIREPADEGKGVTVVEVEDGVVTALTHVPLDTVRWKHLTVDVTGAKTSEDVLIRAELEVRQAATECEGCLLATRLTIVGASPASLAIHKDLVAFDGSLRAHIQASVPDVWIEDIVIRTRSDPDSGSRSDEGSLGDLIQFVRSSGGADNRADAQIRLDSLRGRIRLSAPELIDELGLDDDNLLGALLPDVEEAILSLAEAQGK